MTNTIPAWVQAKRDAQRTIAQSLTVSRYPCVVTYRNPACDHTPSAMHFAHVESLDSHDAPDNAPSRCTDDAPDMCTDGVDMSYTIET